MIVRIMGEGQFRIDDADRDNLNELDNVAAAQGGYETAFLNTFAALVEHVREIGTPLGDDELEESDVLIPPADISFDEVREEFTGEGLIPD
jgi:hypothetical protein